MSVFNESGEVIYINEYNGLLVPSDLREKVDSLIKDLEELKKLKVDDKKVIDKNKIKTFSIKSKNILVKISSIIGCVSIVGAVASLSIFIINPIIAAIGLITNITIACSSTKICDNSDRQAYDETIKLTKDILDELKKIRKSSKDKKLNDVLDEKINKLDETLKSIDKLEKKHEKEDQEWSEENERQNQEEEHYNNAINSKYYFKVKSMTNTSGNKYNIDIIIYGGKLKVNSTFEYDGITFTIKEIKTNIVTYDIPKNKIFVVDPKYTSKITSVQEIDEDDQDATLYVIANKACKIKAGTIISE